MSKSKGELVSVKIIPNEQGNPAGKLADAEVVFEAEAGPLSGMKLIGFAVWERRDGGRNVTFPARQYSVNGERRSFALLRPANGELSAQEAIRQCILDAYSRVARPTPDRSTGHPGGAGSAPPPGAIVLLESGSRIACVPPEIEPAFVERTEPWRP